MDEIANLKSLAKAAGGQIFHQDSPGEKSVKNALDRLGINYIQEVMVNLNKYDPEIYWSRFDFYVPAYKAVIEFDGKQHRQYDKKYHKTMWHYVHQKKRDKAEKACCEAVKVKLIRIQYSALRSGFTNNLRNALNDECSYCELR